jgi:chromosome segregation ATPase
MALTASRSELNVALVGESEVSAMLEATKKQMAELETKIRSLTGASKDQVAAVKQSESAIKSANSTMVSAAKRAEGVVEGVDKIKSAFDKVVGVAGFLGSAVTGAITAFNFLREAFDDTAEQTAKLERELKAAEARAKSFKAAVDTVSSSLARLRSHEKQAGQAVAQELEEMYAALGDEISAAEQKVQIKIEAVRGRQKQFDDDIKASRAEQAKSTQVISKTEGELFALRGKAQEAELDFERRRAEVARTRPRDLDDWVKAEEKALYVRRDQFASEISQRTQLIEQAKKSIEQGKEEIAQLEDRAITADITAKALQDVQRETVDAFFKVKEKDDGGGGGGGGAKRIADMAALREAERKQFLEWLGDTQREAAALNKLRADNAKADEVRRNAVRDEAALFEELGALRLKVTAELGNLPTTGITAEAFKDVREKLAKQLADIDRLTAARVQASRDGGMTTAEEDAITAALARQREEMEKLTGMTEDLAVARGKAAQVAAEELEKAKLAKPLEDLEKYKEGIGQLTQMAVPAFGEIGTVLSQVTDQLQKYKDEQISMTQAVTNSASSIAGAIAKQVGGVKAEAAVRAIFETAMGFATLVSNPIESAGHFTAAAMFGLAAGGVLKTGASSSTGGQQAPATRAASTTASSNTGGGGPITNVYNLQTGIVDGQSTARAFRQAEQQARNTGMASAGGW